MTEQVSQSQVQVAETPKASDKEFNFRNLEQKFEKQLQQERQARMQAEQEIQRLSQLNQQVLEQEEDSEPYVNDKKLNKTLAKFGQNTQSEIQKGMMNAKDLAKEELKQEIWLENNPDFYEILQNNADKFAQKAPGLANSILRMPEGFERQKLVYENIKALGIHKAEVKQPSIQEKIEQNKRSPYYQPSGVGTSPYTSVGDFSPQGQKQAYEKLQQLKNNLKL